MSEAPSGFDLLTLATAQLRRAASGLDAQTRYQILLATRAAEIALRDQESGAARLHAEKRLAALASADDIRAGTRDGDAEVHAALMGLTAVTAYATRPDVSPRPAGME